MKIAIISDTHDNTPAIEWIIEYLNSNDIKTALHAGDIINPVNIKIFDEKYLGELHFVFGNNDGDHGRIMGIVNQTNKLFCYHESMEKEFSGKKFFMNHYSDVSEIAAKSNSFDYTVGGHDHQFRVVKYNNCIFINPGTTSLTDVSRGRLKKSDLSFLILDLESSQTNQIFIPENI